MAEPIQPVTYRKARLGDYFSAAAAYVGLFLVRLLPVDAASAMGGFLGRTVGPKTRAHRTVLANLRAAFPDKDADWINDTALAAWDNFGRASVEGALRDRIFHQAAERVEVVGEENMLFAKERNEREQKPVIFFAAHTGNWEFYNMIGLLYGMSMHSFYRAPNNPLLLKLFSSRLGSGEMIPKGSAGAKRALMLLKKGEGIGILIDQKQNDGIPVPFFGRDAMTGKALADFALRFDATVLPVNCVRKEGAHFRIEVHPPFSIELSGDKKQDVPRYMAAATAKLESFIREHPGQWLWMHRRWPKQ